MPSFSRPLFLLLSAILLLFTIQTLASTAYLRVLYAASQYSVKNPSISLHINSHISLTEIHFGLPTQYTTVPAETETTVAIVNHTNPLRAILRPDEYYTLVFFEVDTKDEYEISPWFDFSTPVTNGLVLSIINQSTFATHPQSSQQNELGLSIDFNIIRFVNLIPTNSLPTLPAPQDPDNTDPPTQSSRLALLYKAHDCVGCNFCVFAPNFSKGKLPNPLPAGLNYWFSSDTIAPHNHETQILIVRHQSKRAFDFRIAMINDVDQTYQPKDGEHLLFSCDYPNISDRYVALHDNYGPILRMNRVNFEHKVETLFFLPPPPSPPVGYMVMDSIDQYVDDESLLSTFDQVRGGFFSQLVQEAGVIVSFLKKMLLSVLFLDAKSDNNESLTTNPFSYPIEKPVNVAHSMFYSDEELQSQFEFDLNRFYLDEFSDEINTSTIDSNNNSKIISFSPTNPIKLPRTLIIHNTEIKGTFIWLPFICTIIAVLFVHVISTLLIRIYQRYSIDLDLNLQLEEIMALQQSENANINGTPPGGNHPHRYSNGFASQNSSAQTKPAKPTPPRLESLDCFRGVIICAMVFCNTGGGGFELMEHAPWNGFLLADIIFPGFVWIMGVSSTLSSRSFSSRNVSKTKQLQDILIRSVKLFLIGLFLANIGKYKTFRIFGILQRFAIAYFAISILNLLPTRPVPLMTRLTPNTSTQTNHHVILPQSHSFNSGRISQNKSSLERDKLLFNKGQYNQYSGTSAPTHVSNDAISHQLHHQVGEQEINNYYKKHSAFVRLLKDSFRLIYQEIAIHLYQWIVIILIAAVWSAIFFAVPAPGCERGYSGPGGPFVHNGAFADNYLTFPSKHNSTVPTREPVLFMCTGGISGYIDHLFLGNHMFQAPTSQSVFKSASYDPEGIFGALMTIICAFFGVVIGRVLQLTKASIQQISVDTQGILLHSAVTSQVINEHKAQKLIHLRRIVTWALWSVIFLILTIFLTRDGYPFGLSWITPHSKVESQSYTFPLFSINKNLWTISFVTFSTFLCTIGLILTYLLVDYFKIMTDTYHGKPLWCFSTPFVYVGMNSLMLFVLPNVLATKFPFVWTVYSIPTHTEAVLMSFNAVIWVVLIATYSFKNKIFWKV
jgi:predicted acyltransferase